MLLSSAIPWAETTPSLPSGEEDTETLDDAGDSFFSNRVDVIKIDVLDAEMVAMHTRHEQ